MMELKRINILAILSTTTKTSENQVLSMYAKEMTKRDTSFHLRDIYGVDASVKKILHMADRIQLEDID